MTNFESSLGRRWITRGRVLVGLPMAFGLLVCVLSGIVALRPAWKEVRELGQRRDSLLQLQRKMPILQAQLDKETSALEQAQQRQDQLIGLLAGREKVRTFLALLNQQALLAGVDIQRYEPLQALTPSPSSRRGTARSGAEKSGEEAQPRDPLSELGYLKSSIAFAVIGPYSGIQEFLQRMEALELLVESSDLEISAVETSQSYEDSDPQGSTTELTLQLGFYDRQTDSSPEADQSLAKPPI